MAKKKAKKKPAPKKPASYVGMGSLNRKNRAALEAAGMGPRKKKK